MTPIRDACGISKGADDIISDATGVLVAKIFALIRSDSPLICDPSAIPARPTTVVPDAVFLSLWPTYPVDGVVGPAVSCI